MPLNISKPNRVDSLDYLRGLMAFLIMLYHYFSWHYYGFDSKDFMGRIGVYGVSMFYILSGLTLYIVYKEKLFLNGYWQYFKRRILRIYPLLILITLLTIFLLKNYIYVLTTARPLESLLLNISGIFGFVEPKRYIATGWMSRSK
jgi:peptidoglycan/LPS O-acetylase OafA/YrhL